MKKILLFITSLLFIYLLINTIKYLNLIQISNILFIFMLFLYIIKVIKEKFNSIIVWAEMADELEKNDEELAEEEKENKKYKYKNKLT